MSALEFLSPDRASPEAVWRSPLERFLRDAPAEVEDLSRLAKLEVRGEGVSGTEPQTPTGAEVVTITHERALVLCAWEDAARVRSELAGRVVVDVSAGLAGLRLTGTALMRRLTDLDLDALPSAGPFAGVDALVVRDGEDYRIFFPQEYGRYVCETVLDALEGLK